MQSALAMLAPQWGFGQLIDISDVQARDNLAKYVGPPPRSLSDLEG